MGQGFDERQVRERGWGAYRDRWRATVFIAGAPVNTFWYFALIDAVPVLFVVVTNPLKGLARLVAPDTLVMAILYAIFAGRPLYGDRFGPSTQPGAGFYGLIPTYDGQMTASYVGMVLLWSIGIGVACHASLKRGRQAHDQRRVTVSTVDIEPSGPTKHIRAGRAVLVTIAALTLYSAALIVFMGLRGFLAMSGGRSAEAWTGSTPEVVMIFPLAGSIASAVLILNSRARRMDLRTWAAIGFCSAATLVAVSQLGQRRLIIPAALIVVTALLMRRPVRLRLSHLVMGGLALMALAVLPNVRGGRGDEGLFDALVRSISETGPLGATSFFFTSYDTQMYDYIAMLAPALHSGRLDLGLGRGSVLEFLAHPFPTALTPFAERSTELKVYLFNHHCFSFGSCRAPNPVLSVGGTLYFDWGYVGVLVGGILVGITVRALAYRWSRAASLTTSQAVTTAVWASYAVVAARTDTIFAIWWAIYSAMIALVVLAAMGEGEVLAKLGRSRTANAKQLTVRRPVAHGASIDRGALLRERAHDVNPAQALPRRHDHGRTEAT